MQQNYRADIDFLRAIAVSMVFLFHLKPGLFPGGFLGVDVFFVISGFVITKSIQSRYTNNSFAFLDFWKRRFLRLYPTLLLTSAVLFVFSITFLIIPEFKILVRGIRSALLGFGNVYALKHQSDYFAKNDMNLMLHTWSLGVEMQFYFLLSTFYFIRKKFVFNHMNRVFLILLIISLLLFISCNFIDFDIGKYSSNNFSFYMLPTRAWQLLTGCALANVKVEFSKNSFTRNLKTASLIGILITLFLNLPDVKVKALFHILATVLTSIYLNSVDKLY